MSGNPSSTPAEATLEDAACLLAQRAADLDLSFEAKPDYAEGRFSGGSDSTSARLEPSDLPNHVRGLQIGRYAVLVTLLPEVPDEGRVAELMRRLRNQCVVARSHLNPAAVVDLHAILVGPRGSEGVDKWKAVALIAERDERVARKLVWLRPREASADAQSFADFIKRSFLARPWVTSEVYSMAPLDNLSRAAAYRELPRDTAGEWIRLASEPDIDPDVLVDGLIASWQRRSAS